MYNVYSYIPRLERFILEQNKVVLYNWGKENYSLEKDLATEFNLFGPLYNPVVLQIMTIYHYHIQTNII